MANRSRRSPTTLPRPAPLRCAVFDARAAALNTARRLRRRHGRRLGADAGRGLGPLRAQRASLRPQRATCGSPACASIGGVTRPLRRASGGGTSCPRRGTACVPCTRGRNKSEGRWLAPTMAAGIAPRLTRRVSRAGLRPYGDNSPIRPPGSESTPVETHEKPRERGVYEAGIRAFLTTWFQTNRWSRVLFSPIGFWSRSGDTVTGLAGTVLSCKEINPFQARRRLRILARSVRPVI